MFWHHPELLTWGEGLEINLGPQFLSQFLEPVDSVDSC